MQYVIDINPKDATFMEEFFNKMKIRFTKNSEKKNMAAEDESPYNAEFVAKIKESEKQFEEGKYTSMTMDELKNFLGI